MRGPMTKILHDDGDGDIHDGVDQESGMRSADRTVHSATCATVLLAGVLVGWAGPSSGLVQRSDRVALAAPAWRLDTPLPQKQDTLVARRGADGLIYAFGSGPKIDVLNPSTHRWSVRTPGSATSAPPRADSAGLIYMVSGRTFRAFDPRTNSWTERAPVPVERYDAAVVTGKDGKIYVLGGYGPDPKDNSNSLYRRGLDVYDPGTDSWQVKAPMPTGREGLGAAVGTDGTIYAIGGGTDHYDRFYSCYAVVEAFNPRTNTWSTKPPLPQPMCGVTAGTTAKGAIVAVGGSTVGGGEQASRITAATGRLVAFKPGAHTWTVLSRAPFPRKHAGAVVEPNGAVYLMGGADRFGHATATVQTCAYCNPG
jgi:Kelch motif/PQQ-like domain